MPDITPTPTPTPTPIYEPGYPVEMEPPQDYPDQRVVIVRDSVEFTNYENQGYTRRRVGGSRRRHRHRPSRKYKKSAKRVFRKKSRSTRRR